MQRPLAHDSSYVTLQRDGIVGNTVVEVDVVDTVVVVVVIVVVGAAVGDVRSVVVFSNAVTCSIFITLRMRFHLTSVARYMRI